MDRKAPNIKKAQPQSKTKKSPDLLIAINAIRYTDIEKHVLLIDRQTRFNLAANPIPENASNAEIVFALIDRGAVRSDYRDQAGNTAPALQRFNEETGTLIYQCHYRAGLRQNPAKGIYAEQFFDIATGKKSLSCSYDEYIENSRAKPEKSPKGRTPKLPPSLARYIMKDAAPVL